MKREAELESQYLESGEPEDYERMESVRMQEINRVKESEEFRQAIKFLPRERECILGGLLNLREAHRLLTVKASRSAANWEAQRATAWAFYKVMIGAFYVDDPDDSGRPAFLGLSADGEFALFRTMDAGERWITERGERGCWATLHFVHEALARWGGELD